ncbi:MAG: response regulator, partial [Bacteroidota bacterium]|nr:response regulator [Bacteroidota bacterium]
MFYRHTRTEILIGVTMAEKNNILVVDDEEALRTVLSSELESEGYAVVSAGDGDEAMAVLQEKPFDL